MADAAADAPPDEDAGAAVPPGDAPSPLAARLAELVRQAEQQAQQARALRTARRRGARR